MRFRLAAIAAVLVLAMGAFAARTLLGDQGDAVPVQTSQRATTATRIGLIEQRVRDTPADAALLSQLAALYLQRARETGDPSYYGLAQKAADQALAIAPTDSQALVVAGGVALARHDFEGALAIGERARAAHPDVVAIYGVLTDAHIELGQYEAALVSSQEMLDRRPDFASYSRASYLRELHGDIDGAIEAMELAARAAPSSFDEAWARVLAGNLQLIRGDLAAAALSYDRAGAVLEGDPMVGAAQARLAIARGDASRAEELLRVAVTSRPLPEYATALGDLLSSQGRTSEAEEQYALVRATQQLFAAGGVNADLELALFDADHGNDPAATYAQARAAYDRRPGVYAADVVAWAAYKAGDIESARRYSAESLRIGTRDPRLALHAGVIAEAAGDTSAARGYFEDAVAMESAQSPVYAPIARTALAQLSAR